MKRFLLVMALGAFLDRAEAASFQVEHWHSRRYHLTIWGEIHQGDDERFKAVVLEQLRAGNLISAVNTFSPGGDIDAARDRPTDPTSQSGNDESVSQRRRAYMLLGFARRLEDSYGRLL